MANKKMPPQFNPEPGAGAATPRTTGLPKPSADAEHGHRGDKVADYAHKLRDEMKPYRGTRRA